MIILRQKEFGGRGILTKEKAKQIIPQKSGRKVKRALKKAWEKSTEEYKEAAKGVAKEIKEGGRRWNAKGELSTDRKVLGDTREKLRELSDINKGGVNTNWHNSYAEIGANIPSSEFAKRNKHPKYTKARINTTGSQAFPYTTRK